RWRALGRRRGRASKSEAAARINSEWNNLRVPGSIRATRVPFGALAERFSSVPLETFFQPIRNQTSNIKHLKSDLLFKNKDDQFRISAQRSTFHSKLSSLSRSRTRSSSIPRSSSGITSLTQARTWASG